MPDQVPGRPASQPPVHEPMQEAGFLSGNSGAPRERRALTPWLVAGAIVMIVLAALLIAGRRKQAANPGGTGLASPDAYASSLPITNIVMSESSNLAGGKVTYVDGQIANQGGKTLESVTVQVAFKNDLHRIVQKDTMPLALIRTRQPYVDTQPVSAAPIKPGEQREFRLILDHVAEDWNQQYPEVRVIDVHAR